MSRTPWIVAYDSTRVHRKPPMSFECLRCKATLVPSLPISVDAWTALAKLFGHQHRKCEPRL